MNIQVRSTNQYFHTTKVVKKQNTINDFDSNIKTEELKAISNIKEELKQSYDIRNSTYEEMCEASRELLHSGEISLLQHMQMTMDYSRLPNVTKGSPIDNMFNDGQKKDWINIFQERANLQLSSGNMDGYNSYINIINILEKVF